jgi:uncharacterized membrane protein
LSSWFAACVVTLLISLAVFELQVFSDVFHGFEQRRLGNVDALQGVRPAQLIDELQAYFRAGGLELMDQPVFSYRERQHYREVKRLLRLGRPAMFALCGVLGVGLWRRARRGVGGMWQAAGAVCYRSAALLAVVPLLGGLLALDFDRTFLSLHQVLFESRTWVLPSYSLTARLFPRQFFVDFGLVYLVATSLMVLLLVLAGWMLNRRRDRLRAAA